ATRVKYFIKFIFKKITYRNKRQTRLRKLNCNTLKFCGLAYKVKNVLKLLLAEFNFLIANIADFIHR
ncbi:hypothetical protein V2W45_1248303, partial [Cenococcum geophilum]